MEILRIVKVIRGIILLRRGIERFSESLQTSLLLLSVQNNIGRIESIGFSGRILSKAQACYS
jgi:hypothetical protein